MAIAQVGGVELAYELRGQEGDPLVLVHGSWVDRRSWDRILPVLEGSFRVLVYDRRGHGGSERTASAYRIDQDVEDLAGLLHALDHFPAHVLGHSLGGSVAARLATSRPDLLRSLLVHEPPLFGLLPEDDPEVARVRETADLVAAQIADGDARGAARRFIDSLALRPGAWAGLPVATQELLVANAPRWAAEYADATSFVIDRGRLREFDPPALVTTGEESLPVYARVSEALFETLPNATLTRLPRVGHLPHVTDPALYLGVLLSFTLERNVPTS